MKRVDVGQAVLEQLDRMIQAQSATVDMSLNQDNAVPVMTDWGLAPGWSEEGADMATLDKAEKMLCQVRDLYGHI